MQNRESPVVKIIKSFSEGKRRYIKAAVPPSKPVQSNTVHITVFSTFENEEQGCQKKPACAIKLFGTPLKGSQVNLNKPKGSSKPFRALSSLFSQGLNHFRKRSKCDFLADFSLIHDFL